MVRGLQANQNKTNVVENPVTTQRIAACVLGLACTTFAVGAEVTIATDATFLPFRMVRIRFVDLAVIVDGKIQHPAILELITELASKPV